MTTIIGCMQCNKNFKISPYELNKRKYCSNACRTIAQKAKAKNIFYEWNDKSAYILGFIWADGNIYKQQNKSMILDIASKDKELIEKINSSFDHRCKVYQYQPKTGNKVYSTKTRDKEIINFLIREGMIERKTFCLNWPETLPEKFYSAFIRGYFDGDGCVFLNKVNGKEYLHCSFTSIKTLFLDKLFLLLKSLNMNPKWYDDKRTEAYQIRIYSKEGVKAFAEYIYRGETICLMRKKRKFLDYEYLN
jgi:intein/homing endonuclease